MSTPERLDFATLTQPGTVPKLDSIFQVSDKFLQELRLWFEMHPFAVPLSQVLGYEQQTQATRLARSAFSVANATNTVLDWDSEVFDFGGLHDLSTNPSRITIETAGKYLVGAYLQFVANATGVRVVSILLNGSTISGDQRVTAGAGVTTNITPVALLDLAVGDYVEVLVFQNSGVSLNVTGNFYAVRVTN
jgi:hypothetical protein